MKTRLNRSPEGDGGGLVPPATPPAGSPPPAAPPAAPSAAPPAAPPAGGTTLDLTEALGLLGDHPQKDAILASVTGRLQKQNEENKTLRGRALGAEGFQKAVLGVLGIPADKAPDLAEVEAKLKALQSGGTGGSEELKALQVRLATMEAQARQKDEAEKIQSRAKKVEDALVEKNIIPREARDFAQLLQGEFVETDGKFLHRETGATPEEFAAKWAAERPYLVQVGTKPGAGAVPPAGAAPGVADAFASATAADLIAAALSPKK